MLDLDRERRVACNATRYESYLMSAKPPLSAHIGHYIKAHVLPADISVKAAAGVLGVSRPTLSKLLNGNASLSTDMALRLQRAFGADSEELLKAQAEIENVESRDRQAKIPVRTYARSFLQIRANDIQSWASGRIETRQQLAALLRRLVNTTGIHLTKVDFPAYDDAERPGWDGCVEAGAATPWIPIGSSGWEFGCDARPEGKAQRDYGTRLRHVPEEERKNMTFVFVTPHKWTGKQAWEKARRAEQQFHDVRAFDAGDLEQWLEQSVATQTWFAELIGASTEGLRSLDSCWSQWAEATEPALSKELFSGQAETAKGILTDWLCNPTSRPLAISAESSEEALAFLHCAAEALDDATSRLHSRCIVVDSADALQKAVRASTNFIAVVTSRDAEEAIAGLYRSQPVILIRPRSSLDERADIALDALDDDSFQKGMQAMGIDEHEGARLARASRQYPTILRRTLSTIPAIRRPVWSEDPILAQQIVRMGLAGAWVTNKPADRAVLAALFGTDYERVEEVLAHLRQVQGTPIWEAGNVAGVTSKVDILAACGGAITNGMIDRFFDIAKTVLSETDPALDLPEDEQWAASIYGKTRDHSGTLRSGICESLVLLAVSGDKLFGQALGINCRTRVDVLIRALLTPFNERTWLSQRRDLQHYAEASPEVFLDIVEDDLNSDAPKIHALMGSGGDSLFSSCPRTGLLWALESLAWDPERMPRVVEILATLSTIKITDNIGNKPEASLKAIFLWWMPQTAANVQQRVSALERLCRRQPRIGWRVCLAQLDTHSASGSSRPRWRHDGIGAGEVDQGNESRAFLLKAVDLAIDWPQHDHATLGDLVEHMHKFDDERANRLWSAITSWRATNPPEEEMAVLRERIRRHTDTRRGRRRTITTGSRAKARTAYESLAPQDVVIRYQWLFANHWVDESCVELEEENYDFRKRDERIAALRVSALKEVWEAQGYEGFLRLCVSGNAATTAGWHLSHSVIESDKILEVLLCLIDEKDEQHRCQIGGAISGVLNGRERSDLDALMSSCIEILASRADIDGIIRLLLAAPFNQATWCHVDKIDAPVRERYWADVVPRWEGQTLEEFHAAIVRLVEAKRPRAAFEFVSIDLEKIEPQILYSLLGNIATIGNEPAGTHLLSAHSIRKAIDILDKSKQISEDAMASLEFTYIDAIEQARGNAANLERQLAKSPILYVQALSYLYRRSDDGEDPAEWKIQNPEVAAATASRAHSLLTHIRHLPGTREDGSVDEAALIAWIEDTRRLAKDLGRLEPADKMIGELLYSKKVGGDGIWPQEPVREALEHVRSRAMARGMSLATYNGRGVTWRGEGGQQERDLATAYQRHASALAYSHPFVSQMLQQIAQFYERDAAYEDASAAANKRLRH